LWNPAQGCQHRSRKAEDFDRKGCEHYCGRYPEHRGGGDENGESNLASPRTPATIVLGMSGFRKDQKKIREACSERKLRRKEM
jgi:hypothetical protein